jgi:hypothetical protein
MTESGANVWRGAFTDQLGRFRFRGLPPGRYTVLLGHLAAGFGWQMPEWAGTAVIADGETVTLIGEPW